MNTPLNTKESFNRWTEAGVSALEPLIELKRLGLRTMERVGEVQIETGRDYLKMQQRQLERMRSTRDINDLSSNHQDFASDFADTASRHLEKLQEIGTETQQAYAEWMQGVVEKAAATGGEQLRTATEQARQATEEASDAAEKTTRKSTSKKS
jgi:division protein CdvB (Snf7/Vps24/ESCRT-III family)